MNAYIDSQKHQKSDLTAAGHPDPHDIPDNKMVDEGAMTSVQYYNEEVQDKSKKSSKDTKEVEVEKKPNLNDQITL